MNFKLTRPIVFFDLEATGINVSRDRIVEISVVKIFPDYSEKTKKRLINPGIPIPGETTEIHGISDEDVKDAPTFRQVAKSFFEFLENCDLGGFNIIKFDVPLLIAEFKRCDLSFSTKDKQLVDVQKIYHKKEPRTLAAALKFYCNEKHENAHGAEEDARATIRVLNAQLEKYDDMPSTVVELAEYSNPKDPSFIDMMGKLRWRNDEVVIGFGHKSGMSLRELADKEPNYLQWILRGDFSEDIKIIVKNAIQGEFLQKSKQSDKNQVENSHSVF